MLKSKLKSQLCIILYITLLDSLALNSTRPIVSIYASELGSSAFLIGLLVSTFAVFPMIFAIQFGKWADHWGVQKMTFFGGCGALLSLFIPIISPDLTGLFLSQAALGLSHNCIMTSIQKGVSVVDGNRDKAVSSLTTTFSVGDFIGPLGAGFLYESFGFQATYAVAAVSIVVLLTVTWFIQATGQQEARPDRKGQRKQTFILLKNANIRKGIAVGGIVIYSRDIFVAYFPIYAASIGFLPSQIGIILSVVALASVVVRFLQFTLVEKFPRETLTIVCMMSAGITFFLTPFIHNHIVFYILALVMGSGLGLVQPLCWVYLLTFTPAGREGEVLGMRSMLNRLGQFTAPLALGAIGGSFGVNPVFWTCGLSLIGGGLYSRPYRDKRPDTPQNRIQETY